MKLLQNLKQEINKLEGKYGFIIKLYLALSLGVFFIAIIIIIAKISFESFFIDGVEVFRNPIRDVTTLDQVLYYANQENIQITVTPNGIVLAENKRTAERLRATLSRENVSTLDIDAWRIYDIHRHNVSDFERNVNLQRARENMIVNHIKKFEGIHDVSLFIVVPQENHRDTNVSLVIVPIQGSDIAENRQKIMGIQNILMNSISGLREENIVITDHLGFALNDFFDAD